MPRLFQRQWQQSKNSSVNGLSAYRPAKTHKHNKVRTIIICLKLLKKNPFLVNYSFLYSINFRNKFLSATLIRPYFDQDFSIPEFVRGAKESAKDNASSWFDWMNN